MLSTQAGPASCGYDPDTSQARSALQQFLPARVLVLGQSVDDLGDRPGELRFYAADEANLPEGYYWFEHVPAPGFFIVPRGTPPMSPEKLQVEHFLEQPDHHLHTVNAWFEHYWELGHPVPRAQFPVGADVVVRGSGLDGAVKRRTWRSGCWFYVVRVSGSTKTIPEHDLGAPDDGDDPIGWLQDDPAPASRFAATLTRAKLTGSFTDTLFSFQATRTLFRPYQFRPVIKLLETGRLRLLVADEVGLGKTIEAGLLWTELEARRQADRVLVLTPSGLVDKWKREMEERFGFELKELDGSGLDEFSRRLAADTLPARHHHICSIERLRAWKGLEQFSNLRPQFDLVIVDEAHVFRNAETKSHALGGLISYWADALVFLSATPLNLRNEDLFNLLDLLVPGEFEDKYILEEQLRPTAVLQRVAASLFDPDVDNVQRLRWLEVLSLMPFGPPVMSRPEFTRLTELLSDKVPPGARQVVEMKRLVRDLHALSATVTRTRKVEVQEDKAVRQPCREVVTWTQCEADFYAAYYGWCAERAQEADMPIGFAMQMPLRLGSTCLQVAKHQVLEWHRIGAWQVVGDTDAPDDHYTRGAQLPAVPASAELVRCAEDLGDVDTKLDVFRRLITDMLSQRRRTLVFTFSKPTLAYLRHALEPFCRVAVLHGGVPKPERRRIMQDFRAGDYDVVLANRVASEGLDFEFCSAVVNYDLPWNPMEVEQRIGRLDRIGQQEAKILVINFHTPGTIDSDILHRVMDRIGVFERSVGELEPIVQSKIEELQRTFCDFRLTAAQRRHRGEEILAAIEEKGQTKTEIEDAGKYLLTSDSAEIEGLEARLLESGRYVGQSELALLVDDWARSAGAAPPKRRRDGTLLTLQGNPVMADQVDDLSRTGERSRSETSRMSAALRSESDVHVALDQELSRTSGIALLTANHPLVRAALRTPGHRRARFTSLRLTDDSLPLGHYVVLMATASWKGVRPGHELWTQCVHADSGRRGPSEVADFVLARLAEAGLTNAPSSGPSHLTRAVEQAAGLLLDRLAAEQGRHTLENRALLQVRRVSLRQVSDRKERQIQQRIETMRSRDKEKIIPMHEGQLRNERERLSTSLRTLEAGADCSMSLEHIAVCEVRVGV